MIVFLLLFFSLTVNAQTSEPVSAPPAATVAPPVKDASEYEVDYEEEPGNEEAPVDEGDVVEEKPVVIKNSKTKIKKIPKERVLQGSIAEKRFAPILKSNVKSLYKKNGKSLDVDSD